MEANETPADNQASGSSIFWALVALALNAMTEPSRIGILVFRTQSDPGATTHSNPTFDTLRSSPLICAAETVLDIFFFIVNPKRPTGPLLLGPAVATTHYPEPRTDSTASYSTTIKIIAFFLGVVPQAIKLFSMGGIAKTQICAAMFLAASVMRAISYKSSSHFARSFDALKDSRPAVTVFAVLVFIPLLVFTIIAHYVIYIWLYFNFAARLFLDDAAVRAESDDPRGKPSIELAMFAKYAYMFLGMNTVFLKVTCSPSRSLTTGKWLPMFTLMLLQQPWVNPAKLAASHEGTWLEPLPQLLTNFARAMALIVMSIIGCVQVSTLFIAMGRVLSRLVTDRASSSSSDRHESSHPMSPHDDCDTRLMSRFSHILVTLWRGLVWLKNVFMAIREEINNQEDSCGTFSKAFGATNEQIGLAWGIFHLLTALLYYLVVFDSTGTSSPSWTSALG